MPLALAAMAFGLLMSGGLVAALVFFQQSLGLTGGGLAITTAGLIGIGAIGLGAAVPGFIAVRHAAESRRLAASGRSLDARVAADDAVGAAWYSLGLGITAGVVAFGFLFLAANNGAIRDIFLNMSILRKTFAGILGGFWLNVSIFMLAQAFVLVWALVVAVARSLPGRPGAPVRFLAVVYTDLFRGLPAILTIFLVVFGLQLSNLPILGDLSVFQLSVMALVLTYGAYVAEVYRAGIDSVHWSQTAAARSLGLSSPQTLRFVVLPQAVRRVIPPLLNDFIGLQKDTALVSTVGLLDAFNRARFQVNKYFEYSPMVGVAISYIVITIPLARFTDYLIKRDAERMRAGGA